MLSLNDRISARCWKVAFSARISVIKRLFSSQLRINMVSGVAVTAANAGIMGVAYPLYLHFLGYEQYGLWLVLATVLGVAQLGNVGIDQAVMKLVAEAYGHSDTHAVEQYISNALGLLLFSGVAILCIVLVFRGQIVGLFRVSPENRSVLYWLLPYVGALSIYVFLVQVLAASLSGLGRMDLSNYMQTVGRAAGLGISGFLLWKGRGVESLLVGSALTYVVLHLTVILLIRRVVPLRLLRLRNLSLTRCRRLLTFGSAVFGGSIMTMLFSPFNRLMLSRYTGLASIPVYDIAFNAAMQIRAFIEAGLRAMIPEVSRIGAHMSIAAVERIRQINRRAMGVVFLGGMPIYLALMAFSPVFLRLWLGNRFVDEMPVVFRIFLIGTFVSLLCVPAYYTLLGVGRATHCFIGQTILSVSGVLMVLMTLVLKGRVSAGDVAFASLPGFILTSSYIVIQQRRTLDAAWREGKVVSNLDQMQSETT